MQEKVVGTSFVRQIPFEELNGTKTPKEETERGIEQFHTEAYLQPEPTNPYDRMTIHKYSDIGLLNSYILEEELENTFAF